MKDSASNCDKGMRSVDSHVDSRTDTSEDAGVGGEAEGPRWRRNGGEERPRGGGGRQRKLRNGK